MIVIYGTRRTGKVHQRGGQYGVTRFAHIYWLPLIPVDAMWMTSEERGHGMKMTLKGVAAGYARTWGFVLGAVGVATGGVGFAVGAAAFGLGLASFAWKDARGDAQRRSDFNLAAFGTRCEPQDMPRELVELLRPDLERRWALVADGQSPSDVARFGTDDATRAAVAYGVLRLTALSLPGSQAREAESDAVKIALGQHEAPQLTEGGPYRSPVVADEAVPPR